MKFSIRALLGLETKGVDKAAKETKKVADNLGAAEKSAKKLNKTLSGTKTGKAAIEGADGLNKSEHRTVRGTMGSRNSAGRNFSGIAGSSDTGQFVAAYAVLAANVFALTSAFQRLSDAAKFDQLVEGLDLVGARAGHALSLTAKGLREVTDNAISTAESMRTVAQATAAGFSGEEIERLGAVARGASLALGRDMSDSIDRLTRGTIKLEPELLDELGIMTRLDQAVKEYALQNNKAASALTQTERRQAFLNAVLDEGERKFADISEQVSANPYDKLLASLKDMGTVGLSVLNKFLAPAAEIMANMPAFAIIPLLGVMKSASSKVLPNLGTAFKKLGQDVDRYADKHDHLAELAAGTNEALSGSREDVVSYLRSGGSETIAAQVEAASYRDIKTLKKSIRDIDRDINTLKKDDAAANAADIVYLRKAKSEMRETLSLSRELSSTERKRELAEAGFYRNSVYKKRINEAADRQAKGMGLKNPLTALGDFAGDVVNDFGGIFSPVEKGMSKTTVYVDRLGTAIKRTGESAATAMRIIGSAASGIFFYVGIGLTVYQSIKAIMENMKTEAEKALDAQKKKLGEVTKAAKKTTEQLKLMFDPIKDQTGLGIDAALNTIQNISKELENLERARIAAENSRKRKPTSNAPGMIGPAAFGPNGDTGIAMSVEDRLLTLGMGKKRREGLAQQLKTLEAISEAEGLRAKRALYTARTAEEAEAAIEAQLKTYIQIQGRTKSITEESQNMKTVVQGITAKPFETGLDKVVASFKILNNELDSLSKLPDQEKYFRLVADNAKSIGIEQIKYLNETNRLYGNATVNVGELERTLGSINRLQARISAEKEKEGEIDEKLIANLEKQLSAKNLLYGKLFDMYRNILGVGAEQTKQDKQELAILEKKAGTLLQILKTNNRILDNEKKRSKAIRDLNIESAGNSYLSIDAKSIALQASDLKYRRESLKLLKDSIPEEKALIDAQAKKKAFDLEESKNGANQDTINYLDSEIKATWNLAKAQKDALDDSIAGKQHEIDLIVRKISLIDTSNLVEKTGLDIDKSRVEAAKEQLAIREKIAGAELRLKKAQDLGRARNRFSKITPDQELGYKRDALQNEKDFNIARAENLRAEHDAKMAILDFEWKMKKVEAKALRAQLEEINNPTAREGIGILDTITGASEDVYNQTVQAAKDSLALALEELVIRNLAIDAEMRLLDTAAGLAETAAKTALNTSKNDYNTLISGIGMPSAAREFYTNSVNQAGGLDAFEKEPKKLEEIRKASLEMGKLSIVSEGLVNIFDTMESGISEAFMGIVDGSKTASQAFGDLAISVIKSISEMIIKMLVFKMITAAMPGGGAGFAKLLGLEQFAQPAAAGGVIPMATGGIMDRGMGVQSVIKQPTYLVGEAKYNEAVVPLPNGRSIPVQMHGSNKTSNVQVNVNLDSSGNGNTQISGEDAGNLGASIAAAVQKQLMEEKRPGGLLNKYGAS